MPESQQWYSYCTWREKGNHVGIARPLGYLRRSRSQIATSEARGHRCWRSGSQMVRILHAGASSNSKHRFFKTGSVPLWFGVPQGSVLGPFLFTLYTGPIGAICRRHGIDYQLYADDTQVYLNFNVTNTNDQKMALKKIEGCVEEMGIWMIQHRLMMNDSKTEFIVIISICIPSKVSVNSITIGESNVPPAPSACNIGVIFDQSFSFNDHISKLCQSGYFSPCQTLPYSDC